MAIALLASESKASLDAEDVTTDAIDTTGATLLVVVLSAYGDAADTTITDSKSNTWVPLTAVDNGGAVRLLTFYCHPPEAKTGSGHTVTTVGSGNLPSVAFAAYSGTLTSAGFDQENGAHFNGINASSGQSGSVTPGEDNELVVAGCFLNPSMTIDSIDGGFTIRENVGTPSLAFTVGLADLIQTTAAAANPTWTFSASTYWAANIATFKAEPEVPADIVLIDSGKGAGTAFGDAVTGALDTTGADFLVVAIGTYDAGITGGSTCSDSKSNTWTPRTLYIEGGGSTQVQLFYCNPPGAKTGASHTFTATTPGGAHYAAIAAAAFSGVNADPYEQENGAEGTGATLATGGVTPSQNGELIVSAVSGESFGFTIDSIDESLTIIENQAAGLGTNVSVALAWLLQAAAAPISPTWTFSAGSNPVAATIATFKAASTAEGESTSYRLLLLGVG